MYSFESVFGNKEVKESTGSNFKNMTPPIKTLEDGTLEIIGFVEDVKVSEWKYDEAKKQLVVTFKNEEGETARKYIQDPMERAYIKEKPEAKQQELSGYVLQEISNIVTKYVYYNTVMGAIKDLGTSWSFQDYVNKLGSLIMGDKSKTDQKVRLKLTFKDSTGVKPEFIIPNSSYLGTEDPYGPKFTKKGDQYDDITNFEVVAEVPDFTSEADEINDVFSGNVDVKLV